MSSSHQPTLTVHLFAPCLEGFIEAAEHPSGQQAHIAALRRWETMLSGLGIPVPARDDQRRQMHAVHTLLVNAARAISESLTDRQAPPIAAGCGSWPAAAPPGAGALREIQRSAQAIDWRSAGFDLLGALHHHLIPGAERRAMGEHYTPRWMAETMCEALLDDGWLAEVSDGSPETDPLLLDPACGSGALMQAAVQRIAESALNRGLNEQSASDAAIAAVAGMDLHPVACEMARAAVLAAVPAAPTLHPCVVMGDALRPHSDPGGLLDARSDGRRRFVAPFTVADGEVEMLLPESVSALPDRLRWLTRAAWSASTGRVLPDDLLEDLPGQDHQTVVDAFKAVAGSASPRLGWWLEALMAADSVSANGADRLIGNPPWSLLEEFDAGCATAAGIDGGMLASSAGLLAKSHAESVRMDVAGVFIARASELFSRGRSPVAAAWVVPRTVAQGGVSWAPFRRWQQRWGGDWTACALNVSPVPFPSTPAVLGCNLPEGHMLRECSIVSSERIPPWSSATEAKPRLRPERIAPEPTERASHYSAEGDGEPWRCGVVASPLCLLVGQPKYRHRKDQMLTVSTVPSQHPPWQKVGSLEGRVPERWVRPLVNGALVLPYTLRPSSRWLILPYHADGTSDTEARYNAYWMEAERIYKRLRDGRSTDGRTLLESLGYHGSMQALLAAARDPARPWWVYRPASGRSRMRAARTPLLGALPAKDTVWIAVETAGEAAYLAALHNAESLQPLWLKSRKSLRTFGLHPDKRMPIPPYDPEHPLHIDLVRCHADAEQIANRVGYATSALSQPAAARAVQEAISAAGVEAKISALAASILGLPSSPSR